jgi:CHAT domain-containing protein
VASLTGRDASEAALKRLGPGRRIIHLATHGFFLGEDCVRPLEGTRSVGGLIVASPAPQPKPSRARPGQTMVENPLLSSGLALAGANRRRAATSEQDDGILTAEEVAALDLEGVEWAVLSACDTGLGHVRAGEGVFGLRRAFQLAGVRTVVMSLWAVEDRSAGSWMRALYEARLGRQLDTADAVHAASLAVLADRRQRKLSTAPFFWAGFVAAGDWR